MTADASRRADSTARDLVLLTLLLLGLQVPFLDQALVIDDGTFVDQAMQILHDPTAPYSFEIHLKETRDFFSYSANPPGQAYFLAAVIWAFGDSELALHLACTFFAALALFAMYGLAREILGRGLLAAALLVSTPGFALSSHAVMPDTAAAAFTLLALLCFVRGVDRPHTPSLFWAGVAAGLAMLFEYSAISLFPLMFVYLVMRNRVRAATLMPLLVAALVFGAWCVASQVIYGEIHVLHALLFESGSRAVAEALLQLLAVLMGAGAATIFPPVLLAWSVAGCFAMSRVAGVLAASAAAAAMLVALPVYPLAELDYDLPNRMLGGLFLAAGLAAVFFVLTCTWIAALRRDGDPADGDDSTSARTLMLMLWFIGFLFIDARLVFATPKYFVPGIAPLILLLLGALPEVRRAVERRPAWQLGTALLTTLALTFAVSAVNASQGSAHRGAVTRASQLAEGHPIWFSGHWTIRYYAERAGHRYLGRTLQPSAEPLSGDLLFVVHDAAGHSIPPEVRPRLREIDSWSVPSPVPLLLANWKARAGYWAHVQGIMPFVLSTAPVSEVTTYRVAGAVR